VKHYVIDTNALLSFVTDRNTAQQAVMTGVFERVAATQALKSRMSASFFACIF
jgi:hypothetical protein